MKSIGEWVHGDSGASILYTVTLRDGSTPDYTNATVIQLVAVCSRPQRSFTLTGSVSSGPSRIFSFASPGASAADPGTRGRDVYVFRVNYTFGGKVYYTEPDQLEVVKWP